MAVVAWTAEHIIIAVYLSWKQHTVSVKRQKRVFHLVIRLKIICVANADRRIFVIAVAPGYIIPIFDPAHSWIIAEIPFCDLRVCSLEYNRIVLNVPVNAVFTKSGKNIHADRFAVTAEHSRKTVFIWDNRTVKHAVRIFCCKPLDNRIFVIAPYW